MICPSPRGYKVIEPGFKSSFSLASGFFFSFNSLNRLPTTGPLSSLSMKMFSYKKIIEKILHFSAAQAPQILSRKKRPNLGRLTVSPETQSPRLSGDSSRRKLQWPGRVPALRGTGKDAHTSLTSETDLCCYRVNSVCFLCEESVPYNEILKRF